MLVRKFSLERYIAKRGGR